MSDIELNTNLENYSKPIQSHSPIQSNVALSTPEIKIPKGELEVNWSETAQKKSASIQNLFSQIARTYDLANDLISLGFARLWRNELVKWSEATLGYRILDCATGTGDLAFAFKDAVGASGTVNGIDFCQDMLDLAVTKSHEKNLPVAFDFGNVLELNHPNKLFDVTSIAYGLRNVERMDLALTEMARVTKSGGYVMILETGAVNNPVFRGFIQFYFEKVVPKVGGWISGKPLAYNYLQTSSKNFPSGQELCDIIMATGSFHTVQFKSLMGGASYIYKATVNE